VVRFIQSGPRGSKVQVIKQTLYRTNDGSRHHVRLAGKRPSRAGSDSVVELKARFDEKSNISWRGNWREGRHGGVRLVGLKTHCKLSLPIRKEDSGSPNTRTWAPATTIPRRRAATRTSSFLTSDPEITEGVFRSLQFPHPQSRQPGLQDLIGGAGEFPQRTLKRSAREQDPPT